MAAEDAQEEVEPQEDIFYVDEKSLNDIKAKLSEKGEITTEMIDTLAFPEKVPDDNTMVPVDMRGVEEEFEDVEQMLAKLGAQGAAEAFAKARAYFEENKDKIPEEERAKPMTAKEWRAVLEQEDAGAWGEGEEEEWNGEAEGEDWGEGEEEEIGAFGEGEEEEAGEGEVEGDEGDGEPAAKKAKTD